MLSMSVSINYKLKKKNMYLMKNHQKSVHK